MSSAGVSTGALTEDAFFAGVFLAAGVAGFFGAGFSFFAIGVAVTFFGAAGVFSFATATAATGVAFSFFATGVAFVFFAGALTDDTIAGATTGITVGTTIGAGALGAGADLGAVTTFGKAFAAGLFLPESFESFCYFTVADATAVVTVDGLTEFAAASANFLAL
jgi:hypothetical protein